MPGGTHTHRQPNAAPTMPCTTTTRPNQPQQQVRRQESAEDEKKPITWTKAEVRESHVPQSYQCVYVHLAACPCPCCEP